MMTIDLGNLTVIHVGILIVLSAGAWHMMREICSYLTLKYFKKIDQDYVTVADCLHMRSNCQALVNVSKSLEEHKNDLAGLKIAMYTILLHSDIPSDAKQQALERLG